MLTRTELKEMACVLPLVCLMTLIFIGIFLANLLWLPIKAIGRFIMEGRIE